MDRSPTLTAVQERRPVATAAALNDHVRGLLEENDAVNQRMLAARSGTPIRSVGVVGAGFMGSALAAGAIQSGLSVVITDKNEEVLGRAPSSILAAMQDASFGVDPPATGSLAGLARTTTNLKEVAGCDLVIESVIENPLVKRQIFRDLEDAGTPDTLIATNTSTLPIGDLATELRHPDRFCGLHFFPPFGERPMLEIIPGSATSDRTAAAMVSYAETLGHIPVVVADGRGFVVNCLLMSYMNAAMKLMLAGADVHAIERAALDFGMRVGPIDFYDLIGLDVAVNSGFSLAAESDSLVSRSPVLLRLVKAKMLGRKTGAGFFVHRKDDVHQVPRPMNPKAVELIAGNTDGPLSLSPQQLTDAILLPLVIEATRLLELGRARGASQIDLAVIFGFGFPMARGGLLRWADQVGAARIVRSLESLAHLGPHLRPTPRLLEMARQGRRFYDE